MLEAIEQLPLAVYLRRDSFAYPIVNALHIFSLGVLVTSALLMDMRVLGLGRRVALDAAIATLRPVAAAGPGGALATGALLFSVRPGFYAANPVFLAKLALLGLALANAALFVLGRRHLWPGRMTTRAQAVLSILLWLAVLLAGRAIAFFGSD